MFKLTGKYTDVKIFQDPLKVEASCLQQIQDLIDSPAYAGCKIRMMPDLHAGVSAPIGTTIEIKDKVIPNTVSVDIGCGMLLFKLEGIKKEDIDFKKLDSYIRQHIPSGKSIRTTEVITDPKIKHLKCFKELKKTENFDKALGTLGGG